MQINENKAGIYIHIPFCKQACTYCNFHFSTSLKHKEEIISAIITEITLRKQFLEGKTIQSIYFGGGTPSLLTSTELNLILENIAASFTIENDVEITLEANPDDINTQKLIELKTSGINRISLGIQSFYDRDLLMMNRSHNAGQAEKSLQLIKDAGFDNITADLIYGIPDQSNAEWESNIQKLLSFNINHISCYALTVEPKTKLFHLIAKNKMLSPDENHAAEQFEILTALLIADGYEHYEISNFAKNQKYSRHNTSYWSGNWYAGFGPSAHSYNGISRQWNISNNALYVKNINSGMDFFESEHLTKSQQINEFIMVSLRTMWGLDKNQFEKKYGESELKQLMKGAEKYITENYISDTNGYLIITSKGKFVSDGIIAELFSEEEQVIK